MNFKNSLGMKTLQLYVSPAHLQRAYSYLTITRPARLSLVLNFEMLSSQAMAAGRQTGKTLRLDWRWQILEDSDSSRLARHRSGCSGCPPIRLKKKNVYDGYMAVAGASSVPEATQEVGPAEREPPRRTHPPFSVADVQPSPPTAENRNETGVFISLRQVDTYLFS